MNELGEELGETETELRYNKKLTRVSDGSRKPKRFEREKKTYRSIGFDQMEDIKVRAERDVVTLMVNGKKRLEEVRDADTSLSKKENETLSKLGVLRRRGKNDLHRA